MSEKLRSHLRNNVVGYVALAVALVGVPASWAVAINSVGSREIKPRAIRASDIHTGAVNSRAIDNGAVKAVDLAGSGDTGATKTRITARWNAFSGGAARPHDIFRCQADEQIIGGAILHPPSDDFPYLNPLPRSDFMGSIRRSFTPRTWYARNGGGWAICARWGEPAQGPPGPPGKIADQQCPAENMFVKGITDGKIDCAYLNIVP
jgi:hypothetical protein